MVHLYELVDELRNENVDDLHISRFIEFAEEFGYQDHNKDILDFFTLVLNKSDVFQDVTKLTKIWRTESMIKEAIKSVCKVCETHTLKKYFGHQTIKIKIELNAVKNTLLEHMLDVEMNEEDQKAIV